MPQTHTSSTKILTPARLAVWEALKGWDKWTAKIVTYAADDHEVKRLLLDDPQTSRCPIIAASWNPANPDWYTHVMQRGWGTLFVSLWVPTAEMTLSEKLLEDAIDAVYRYPAPLSTDAVPVSLVQKTCNGYPEIAALEIAQAEERGRDGQHKLLRSSVALNLRIQKDPIQRAS